MKPYRCLKTQALHSTPQKVLFQAYSMGLGPINVVLKVLFGPCPEVSTWTFGLLASRRICSSAARLHVKDAKAMTRWSFTLQRR